MTESAPSWAAGIVNHGSFDDLERCLESLEHQTRAPERVVVWDTGEDEARLEEIARAYPEVSFIGGRNAGYAGGANRVVDAARGRDSDVHCVSGHAGAAKATEPDYILVLNPDVRLDADFAARLTDAVDGRSEIAIASGKLLRPDRRTLDSAGIEFPRHRRPRDRGSEQADVGQFDAACTVDAASGAAMWLRVSCLDDLLIEGELFDESFFAYHEDTDLCWRARRIGYSVLYEPAAVAIHARGWQKAGRGDIPVEIRRHSFKNHYLQLVKNERLRDFVLNSPWLIGWEILRLGFVLLRDRPMLSGYRQARWHLGRAYRARRQISERAGRVAEPIEDGRS